MEEGMWPTSSASLPVCVGASDCGGFSACSVEKKEATAALVSSDTDVGGVSICSFSGLSVFCFFLVGSSIACSVDSSLPVSSDFTASCWLPLTDKGSSRGNKVKKMKYVF